MTPEMLIEARKRATEFAKANLSTCASEILAMNESGVLKPDGKVRELAKLCAVFTGGHDPLGVAESIVKNLALHTLSQHQQHDFDALWRVHGADDDAYTVARTWYELGRTGAAQPQPTPQQLFLLSVGMPGISAHYSAGHPQGVMVLLHSHSLPTVTKESLWADFNRHVLAAVVIALHLQPDHPVFHLDEIITSVSDLAKLEQLIASVDKSVDPRAAAWLQSFLQVVDVVEADRYRVMTGGLVAKLVDSKRAA